jgi:hypothetical protein
MIHFLGTAEIDLSGAEDGEMAGLLFFEDPAAPRLREHKIKATNAHTMTGTIYLPQGNLVVDPPAAVAQRSAYTAIVSRKLTIDRGPNLVLNTNYNATRVPVPAGIRSAAEVVLSD